MTTEPTEPGTGAIDGVEANTRAIETDIVTDFSERMSYGSYLDLDTLLAAQQPMSDPEHHDELLFIIQHQTTELWLKLVLHELGARRPASRRRARAGAQVHRPRQAHPEDADRAVVGAGHPDPHRVRPVPRRARQRPGFQSAQYRAVEFLLGNKNAAMLRVFDADPARQRCRAGARGAEPLRRVPAAARPAGLPDAGRAARARRPQRTFTRELVPSSPRSTPTRDALGRLRDLRGARRPRGQLPALAVPAPEDGAAHHRQQDRHRRIQRRALPAAALDLTFFPELYAVRTEIPG